MEEENRVHQESLSQQRPPQESSVREAKFPVLSDPWSRRGPIPLNGWLERNAFTPFLSAILLLIAAFFVFQLIGTLVPVVLILAQGVGAQELAAQLRPERLLSAHLTKTIVGNTVGQILGLALPALGVARLHSSRAGSFLRLRRSSWTLTGLAVLGLVALLPVVDWLARLNELLPLPDLLQTLDEMRIETIKKLLGSEIPIALNVLMLAVTPAFCEELLFRGYAQRQLERSAGAAGGVLLSGVLFGMYHLSFAQVLPLSVLGIYLAYLTWRTGSLWPAILVHFVNNAIPVVLAGVATARPNTDLSDLEGTAGAWPWYAGALGLIFFALIVYFLHTRAPAWRERHASPASTSADTIS